MKIKIIDLLNKIYNNEDMPKKVVFDEYVWCYRDEYQDYFNGYNGYLFDVLMNDYGVKEILDIEVELIDEVNKLKENK